MTDALARVTVDSDASPIVKFMLADAGRRVTVGGIVCDSRPLNERLVEHVVPYTGGEVEVQEAELRQGGEMDVAPPEWVRMPKLALTLQTNRVLHSSPYRWRPLVVSDYRYMLWGKTHVAGLAVHLEWEMFDGFAIGDLRIGNTLRNPGDTNGTHVTGDVFFRKLELVAEGQVIWDTYRQHQNDEDLFVQGEHCFPVRRVYETRFAVLVGDKEREARAILDYEHMGRVRGRFAPCTRGAFGPEGAHAAQLEQPELRFGDGRTGYEAVQAFCEKDEHQLAGKLGSGHPFTHLGSKEGNDPGGTDITPGLVGWECPSWHRATTYRSYLYQARHSEMTNARTLEPLTVHDVAEATGGQQPYIVKRTNGSDQRPGTAIPWSREGDYSSGASPYFDDAWRAKDIDHAHAIRLAWPLKYRAYVLGSEMAAHALRALAAHYQFETTPYRVDGNSLPALEHRAAQRPRGGDGALGRQIAWPLHILACAFDLSNRRWQEREGAYARRLVEAVSALMSPAGATRRREAPNWGWASPKPELPDDSPLICDQVFEITYVGLALVSLYGAVAGGGMAMDAFERLARGLNGHLDSPMWGKFVAYGQTAPSPTLFERLRNVSGGSGSPHQGNLCGLAYKWLRDGVFLERAVQWAGSSKPTYVTELLQSAGGWNGVQSHEQTQLNWHLYMLGLMQAKDVSA